MNSELYRLFKEYDGLDEGFINRAFELMMEDEDDLEPFISDFKIVDKNDGSLGAYTNEDRVMEIDMRTIRDRSTDKIKNKKMLALQILRHEIEHARNLQRLYECRDDIESAIIRISLKKYAIANGLDHKDVVDRNDYSSPYDIFKRHENYLINPGERLVDIKAWRYIVNLIKNQRRTEDLLVARSMLYFHYLRGYEDNGVYLNAPTYEYMLNMGMLHEFYLFKRRVEKEQYVFDTRLTYGLPLIQGSEYDEKILRKVRLQKSKRTD